VEAREEPEGAVDVEPGVVLAGDVGDLVDGIELAGVGVPRRGHDDSRSSLQAEKLALEGRRVEDVVAAARQIVRGGPAQAEHAEALGRARVHDATGEHRHPRSRRHPVLERVETVLLAPPLPRRGQTHEVAHRRAGRHDARPLRWQSEELLEPAERDALQLDGER
jgi:hypothetical protein